MTREEAKRRVECCRDFLANNYSDMGEPNFTALNMAIEALSEPKPITIKSDGYSLAEVAEALKRHGLITVDDSEPTKTEPTIITENMTNGDVIKAMFPFKEFNGLYNNIHKSDYVIFDLNGFYMRVSDDWWNAPYKGNFTMPTRPKAKWINKHGGSLIDHYECSNCHQSPCQEWREKLKTWGWNFTKYCPNCGAEMESE